MEILEKGIVELKRLMEAGENTCEEIISAYIKNIEIKNLDKELYRVFCKESALEKARDVDRRRQEGEKLGSLAGIPLVFTDDISSKGILTSAGSKILDNYIAPFNATIVDLLLEEDAILLGKLRIGEFNLEERDYAKRLILENASPILVGSISISQGLVKLSPSYGAVSRYGVIGASSSLGKISIGGKSVEDLALISQVIISYDEKDSASIKLEEKNYLDFLEKLENHYKITIPNNIEVDGEGFSQTQSLLKDLGRIEGADLEITRRYLLSAYKILLAGEFSSNAGRYDGIGFGHRAKDYENREELYKRSRTEGFGKEAKKNIILGNLLLDSEHYKSHYVKAQQIRTIIRDEVDKALMDKDLLVVPLLDSMDDEERSSYTSLAAMTGYPSLSLSYQLVREEGPREIIFLASNFKEEVLLAFSRKFIEAIKLIGGEVNVQ